TAHAQVSESLEQQTATAEILRVISSSPTDVQPVFETILSRAVELCGARHGSLFRFDGELLHAAAHHDVPAPTLEILRRDYPMPPSAGYMSGRAILARRIGTIEDGLADALYESTAPQASGLRSMVGVPLLKDGNPVGVIVIVRRDPGLFTDRQIELLKTFADQAVIGMQNVRLFKELEARNLDLTTALEQRTATAEVLRVISQSPTDVQPVFDAIVEHAVRLCDGAWADAYRFDGERQHLVACSNLPAAGHALLQRLYPRAPDPEAATGRAILDHAVIHVPDAHHDPRFAITRQVSGTVGVASRSVLAVPMLHHGEALGVILVHRGEQPRPFSSAEIDLLKTFADQAVIAIENVRLFTELQEKNKALTTAHAQVSESLEQQTATAEILRV